MTAVGFEPTQLALVELESTPQTARANCLGGGLRAGAFCARLMRERLAPSCGTAAARVAVCVRGMSPPGIPPRKSLSTHTPAAWPCCHAGPSCGKPCPPRPPAAATPGNSARARRCSTGRMRSSLCGGHMHGGASLHPHACRAHIMRTAGSHRRELRWRVCVPAPLLRPSLQNHPQ